jgi:hypothetical protein
MDKEVNVVHAPVRAALFTSLRFEGLQRRDTAWQPFRPLLLRVPIETRLR